MCTCIYIGPDSSAVHASGKSTCGGSEVYPREAHPKGDNYDGV